MTSIVAALLSGFLNAQQIASLSLVCMAELPELEDGRRDDKHVQLKCVLLHNGAPINGLITPPLPADQPVPVPALAQAWCELGAATIIPPSGPAT